MTEVECERCGKGIAVPVNKWLSVSFADRPFDAPIEDLEEDFFSRFTEVQLCKGCGRAFLSFLNSGLDETHREDLAIQVWENSDLTQREVGEMLDRSASWVSRAVNRDRTGVKSNVE